MIFDSSSKIGIEVLVNKQQIRTLTKTVPPVPVDGLPLNPFEIIVVVVFNTGLR